MAPTVAGTVQESSRISASAQARWAMTFSQVSATSGPSRTGTTPTTAARSGMRSRTAVASSGSGARARARRSSGPGSPAASRSRRSCRPAECALRRVTNEYRIRYDLSPSIARRRAGALPQRCIRSFSSPR